MMAVNDNNFGGIFPEFIGNFTWLRSLLLHGNRISGSIPDGIQNLVNLERMEMWENQISGGIPPEIGHLQQLTVLVLSENRLSGNIPFSLGNLTNLTSFYLGLNNLQGGIPSSLGLCKNLLELDLSENNLSGTILKELVSLSTLFILLNLSHNKLNGSFPEEVGNLGKLGALDVSNNMLSGEIPGSLGSCVTLEILCMWGNFLAGKLPSSLSSLKGIRMLDLSRNNLSGQIPKFLEQFDIQYLNLSFNDFDGEMPLQGVFKNASAVSVKGNNRLCGGVSELQFPPCKFNKSNKGRLTTKLKIIISIVFGLLGVTFLLSFIYFFGLRKKNRTPRLKNSENLLLKVSYRGLLTATDGFSSAHLIGKGSFGSVFKGIIDELGTTVAIKVLNLLRRRGASKSFAAECEALRNIRHRNLVKILTACSGIDYQGNDFKALIYEFMVSGSLGKWLHPTPRTDEENETPRSLNLLQGLKIAIDVACALEYLHNDCQPPVVHCDLKPSNILLDEDMVAHVGDFGLARILPEATTSLSNNQTSSIGIRGTIGYTAPEYGMGSEVSTYGDVYSYGILLLEMFTGKRPTNDMFKDSLNLYRFVEAGLAMQVLEIADPILLQEGERERETSTRASTSDNQGREVGYRIYECLIAGVACSAELPRERMSISNVVTELHSIINKFDESGRQRGRQRNNES